MISAIKSWFFKRYVPMREHRAALEHIAQLQKRIAQLKTEYEYAVKQLRFP